MLKNSYIRGIIFCLIATISWGAMFPVMTGALKLIDPFTFTALRYSLAGVMFVLLLIKLEGFESLSLKNERWFLAWIFGSLGFAGFGFLVFLGQQLTGPSGAISASIMMATMPMLGVLVIWILKKNRPPILTVCFILCSFAGVLLVITNGNLEAALNNPLTLRANIALIAGALCWVLYTVGGSYFPHWSPYRYTALTTILGLITIYIILGVMLWSSIIPTPQPSAVVGVAPHLVYMAFVAGFIGVLCWNLGNKILTPLNGVLFMDIVPITAFLISTLYEIAPSNVQLLGASITALALLFNNLLQRRIQIKK